MALRVAIASGNWSNPATWNAGLKPVAGDIAASNGFTVTIDENCNVDLITNTIQSPVKATPNMTGYTTPSGIVTASSENTGGRNVWLAFDGNGGTIGQLGVGGAGWLAYEFPTPIVINAYSWVAGGNEQPSNWTFEGWNGSSWVVLHTVTGGAASYTSPLIGNNTAYIKYRINVSLAYLSAARPLWYEINLFEKGSEISSVAGGGFILNSGVTVTCTNTGDGIYNAVGFICVDYTAASGTSTINANIRGRDGTSVFCVRKSGAGTLNINGTLRGLFSTNANGGALQITGTGTVTITGNISDPSNGGQTVQVDATSTLNIIGSVTSGPYNSQQTVKVNAANCIINITGNLFVGGSGVAGWTAVVLQTNASNITINLSGDIDATNGNSVSKFGLVTAGANNTVNHTGNIIGSSDNVGGGTAFSTSQVIYYNQIGYIKASMAGAGFNSTSASAINILTGPFISSPSGIQPLSISRMHYRRTMGSYFEFRDNSTNGALPPAASAPATRLVAPDTVVDAPIPSNVRFGISYALGSQIGTMKVPVAGAVMFGVAVDNTVGTALLSAAQVWNYLRNDISVSGSIGDRLKNCATVESTGSQIASFKSS